MQLNPNIIVFYKKSKATWLCVTFVALVFEPSRAYGIFASICTEISISRNIQLVECKRNRTTNGGLGHILRDLVYSLIALFKNVLLF
jgi:hypothetical protein